jgi:tetratricopeptide (TPR) repeat protein
MRAAAHIAAVHSALWGFDRAYRLAWYVWPAAMAALICGWISIDAPVAPVAPATPARSTSQPAASFPKPAANSLPVKTATTPVDPVQSDLFRCFSKNSVIDVSMAACNSLIDGAKVKSRQLAEVLTQRGFLRREKDPYGAMADFDEALKIEPAFADAYSNRAWINMTRERYDVAVQDLNKAIDLGPPAASAGTARYYRGYAYQRLGNYQQALTDLDEALKLEPYNADFYLARGEVQRARENYAAALLDFDEAARRAPRDGRGPLGRASILEAIGRPKEALSALDAAIRLDPNNAFAASERERLRAQLAEDDQARKDAVK